MSYNRPDGRRLPKWPGVCILILLLGAIFAFAFSKITTERNQTGADTKNMETGITGIGFAAMEKVIPQEEAVPDNEGSTSVQAERLQGNRDRLCWYQNIRIPGGIIAGDHIDVRLSIPGGRDYVVLSKKKVEGRNEEGQAETGMWLSVTEYELLTMSSAQADLGCFPAGKLYAVKYLSGRQAGAQVNYPVNKEVRHLMRNNPNIHDSVEIPEDSTLDTLRSEQSSTVWQEKQVPEEVHYWSE